MTFDFEHGFFVAVGVSAETVAFEWLGFQRMVLSTKPSSAFRAPALFVGTKNSAPCIAVHPEAESGTIELEYALWRELARALDGLPPFADELGRFSQALAPELRRYARKEWEMAPLQLVHIFWRERLPIPGSPSVHEPHELVSSGVVQLPERLEELVCAEMRLLPGEVFSNAMARFVAAPQLLRKADASLAGALARILLHECGVVVRA